MERLHLFLAFAASLREGRFHGGKPASSSTIERSLRFCGQVLASRGFADPRRITQSDKQLDPAVTQYLRACSTSDPAPKRQQAIPASTVRRLAHHYASSADPAARTAANLVTVAFFFLLRVGEYTPAPPNTPKQTTPLRLQDVTFWNGVVALPRTATHDQRLAASAVTISLDNQKNGNRGDTLHHTRTGDPHFCPVIALANAIRPIASAPLHTPIGTTYAANGQPLRITAAQIRSLIRHGAALDNLEAKGYHPSRIGSHSLRAGGAVALKLAGYDDTTICKMGRWSSNTFLIYIRGQIANLTAGVATAMSTTLTYHNVG